MHPFPFTIFIWRSESKSKWICLVRNMCFLYFSPQKSVQFSYEMNCVVSGFMLSLFLTIHFLLVKQWYEIKLSFRPVFLELNFGRFIDC